MTLLRPFGTVDSPELVEPQETTMPSFLSARAWRPPGAIATTFVAAGGTLVLPASLAPQAMTAPLVRSAKPKFVPRAMAEMSLLVGGLPMFWPHWTRVPDFVRARLVCPPAATARALFKPEGTTI